MANTAQDFEQVFLTYRDVREANPDWTDRMIEDYLSLKRDLNATAEGVDALADENVGMGELSFALASKTQRQIGSGDFLTSDETGFTVDLDTLSVDMDEA